MKGRCWFKGRAGAGACSGPLQRAHWIRQQVLRRELPGGIEQQELVWDPRIWTPMCEAHHRRLDHARTLRVDRADLPPEVEEYARERDLLVPGDREPLQAWLDMEYGPIETEEKAA